MKHKSTKSRVQFIAPKQDGMAGSFGKPQDGRRVAFTLAEVLITLGIIGVVAALTIPIFMENVNDRVKTKRIENIKQKLSKVTDKMASLNQLQGHQSTYDFVIEMKKHMNIAKICENNKISECWSTKEVVIRKHAPSGKSNTYLISKLNNQGNSNELRLYNTFNDWAEPIGIVTGDGTSMIISYNKNCSISSDTGLVYDHASATSNSLSCIAGIYDWNGKARPNAMGDDVQSLGVASLAGSCSYETPDGSVCIAGSAHVSTPIMPSQYDVTQLGLGITTVCTNSSCQTKGDYWAGAVAECGGKTHMFDDAGLQNIADYIYGTGDNKKTFLDAEVKKRAAELGLPDASRNSDSFYVWSGEESDSGDTYSRKFDFLGTTRYLLGRYYDRDRGNFLVLCKGD